MPIYTRTGDRGETDLPDGGREPKDAPLLEVLGTLDELGALLGLAQCESMPEAEVALLEQIQHHLFKIGNGLGGKFGTKPSAPAVGAEDVAALEQLIDRYQARLKPTASFILAGGCRTAAVLHLARAVCRRAERRLVAWEKGEPQTDLPYSLAYLNRLSDLLFVLARIANLEAGMEETPC